MRHAILMLGLAASFALTPPAFAQRGGGPGGQQLHGAGHPEAAQIGAGTTDGTTTGISGPQNGGSKKPPKPDASLCKDYENEVRQSCLSVAAGMSNGAAQSADKKEEEKK